jgi:hypothetical protein
MIRSKGGGIKMPSTKAPKSTESSETRGVIIAAVITAIAGVVVALITYGPAWLKNRNQNNSDGNVSINSDDNVSINANTNVNKSPSPPKLVIKIKSPAEAALAHVKKSGEGWVEIGGTLENTPPQSDLRIFVFYGSENLEAGKWWYEGSTESNDKGEWSISKVWIGDSKDKIVARKNYRIKAIVAKSDLLKTLEKLSTKQPISNLASFGDFPSTEYQFHVAQILEE